MRGLCLISCCLILQSCVRAGGPTPLEQVVASTDGTGVCPTALAQAIDEAESASSDAAVPTLEWSMVWAVEHREVRCRPGVGAMDLWREGLAALERIRTPAAALAIAGSLSVTHRPGSLHDRHNATFREQTRAALRALEATGPQSPDVVDALLRWYGAGALDCSAGEYESEVVAVLLATGESTVTELATRLPPMPGSSRCSPEWLLIDFFQALDEAARERVIGAMSQGADAQLLRVVEITQAMGEEVAPLARELVARACAISAERAGAALEGADDPRRAAETAATLCEQAREPEIAVSLRGRLLRWLASHDRAEEAWALVQGPPVITVAQDVEAEVGGAVIQARLQRGELSEAIAVMETLAEAGLAEAAPARTARDALRAAMLASALQTLESGSFDVSRRVYETAVRLGGDAPETALVGVRLDLAEVLRLGPEACPPRVDRDRLEEALGRARASLAGSLRDHADEALTRSLADARRRWERVRSRCRR